MLKSTTVSRLSFFLALLLLLSANAYATSQYCVVAKNQTGQAANDFHTFVQGAIQVVSCRSDVFPSCTDGYTTIGDYTTVRWFGASVQPNETATMCFTTADDVIPLDQSPKWTFNGSLLPNDVPAFSVTYQDAGPNTANVILTNATGVDITINTVEIGSVSQQVPSVDLTFTGLDDYSPNWVYSDTGPTIAAGNSLTVNNVSFPAAGAVVLRVSHDFFSQTNDAEQTGQYFPASGAPALSGLGLALLAALMLGGVSLILWFRLRASG